MATPTYRFDDRALASLFACLQDDGYRVAGPQLAGGEGDTAIVLDWLNSLDDLPRGYTDTQHPGHYRLQDSADGSRFRYVVGPHSVKQFLYPARQRLWSAARNEQGLAFSTDVTRAPPIALIGIRACDVETVRVLDRVFAGETHYEQRRQGLILITATCLEPADTCFCTSMGGDVRSTSADINLTELAPGEYLTEAGSETGSRLLARCHGSIASAASCQDAEERIDAARARITRSMPGSTTSVTTTLPERLQTAVHHPHWDEVADRCLACGNCTLVCPTCFCGTVDDTIDLEGGTSERWLRWDSCFSADHSALHDGSVRYDTRSRYRQWLTHKLGTWHDQFDMSGCVGCGRCTTWCPVGIDLVAETRALLGAPA